MRTPWLLSWVLVVACATDSREDGGGQGQVDGGGESEGAAAGAEGVGEGDGLQGSEGQGEGEIDPGEGDAAEGEGEGEGEGATEGADEAPPNEGGDEGGAGFEDADEGGGEGPPEGGGAEGGGGQEGDEGAAGVEGGAGQEGGEGGEGQGAEGGEGGEGAEGGAGGEGGAADPGTLCGPAGARCIVAYDDVLDPEHHRNDAPALALGPDGTPHVLFSIAEGGYHGRYAVRSGVARDRPWAISETPMAIARVALAVLPDGRPFAVAYDGALHLTRHILGADGWVQEAAWDGSRTIVAHGVAQATDGTVHMGPFDGNGGPIEWAVRRADGAEARFDERVVADRGQHVVVAVGGDGAPYLTWWSSARGQGWDLMFAGGRQGDPELVTPLGGGGLSVQSHGLAIETDGDGRNVPHVVVSVGQPLTLTHAWRRANGWATVELAVDDPAPGCGGGREPEEGEQCEVEGTTYYPLDAVSSVDHSDVRLLYTEVHLRRKMIARCEGGGGMPPFCNWQTVENTITPTLHIAWPAGGGETETAVVAQGFGGVGTAEVDADGRIHVAVYSAVDRSVRYVRLDAAGNE